MVTCFQNDPALSQIRSQQCPKGGAAAPEGGVRYASVIKKYNKYVTLPAGARLKRMHDDQFFIEN